MPYADNLSLSTVGLAHDEPGMLAVRRQEVSRLHVWRKPPSLIHQVVYLEAHSCLFEEVAIQRSGLNTVTLRICNHQKLSNLSVAWGSTGMELATSVAERSALLSKPL
ncbi:MAG TPA: hypothetical protein VMF89_18525 [Polyangiales bacterium]|nr:hypothetical protein [Polyangiales bacterium]